MSTSIPETMNACEVSELSGPSVLKTVRRPVPQPGKGEVLLKVEAAGLNFADVAQSWGQYVGGPKPPYIPGLEASGEVVAIGEGVQGYNVGDKVIGAGSNAFAEYVAWPARSLLPRPASWSAGQGASFFVAWLTAHGCLRTVGRLKEGETVLVHAAAGGVGQAACRLAKHFGATVIGTSSSKEKLEQAKKAGADHVINYREEDFEARTKELTDGRGADLILEMVGGDTFRKNLKAVRPFGRIVVFGAASGEPADINNVNLIFQPVEISGYHLTRLITQRPDLFAGEMEEVMQLMGEGVIEPEEPTSFKLAEAAEALTKMQQRETTGKVVLLP